MSLPRRQSAAISKMNAPGPSMASRFSSPMSPTMSPTMSRMSPPEKSIFMPPSDRFKKLRYGYGGRSRTYRRKSRRNKSRRSR